MLNRLFISLCIFFLSACAVLPVEVPTHKVAALSRLLGSTRSDAPLQERKKLAQDIFTKTQALTKDFKLTSPPQWHNFLVNVGLREKGLCFHWSDALYLHLQKKEYVHFSFHLVGANVGEYFSEHNALVVVAKGKRIDEGIVIDPWRDSGKLYFSKVAQDKSYTWSHRVDRGCEP